MLEDAAAPSMSSAADRGAVPGGMGDEQRVEMPVGGDVEGQQPPQKKKQKRNKPTLSCEECVERKTKVGSSESSRWRRLIRYRSAIECDHRV